MTDTAPQPDRSVLAVSAHAADFVWRAGGALALAAEAGQGAHVLCLSFGERGESASLWREGKTLDEVKAVTRQDVLDLLGVDELGPVRSKCAMLALKTVKAAAYGVALWSDEDIEQ